jgi:hypothetical protein
MEHLTFENDGHGAQMSDLMDNDCMERNRQRELDYGTGV